MPTGLMTPSVHHDTLPQSEIERRIGNFGKQQWELVRNDVCLQAGMIMLPGFSLGLKLVDEDGLYTREEARETFNTRLIQGEQIEELYRYIEEKEAEARDNGFILTDEHFFHSLLEMRGWVPGYFIEGGTTRLLDRILRKTPEGYTLSPSTPFGSAFIANGTPTTVTSFFDGAVNFYKIGRTVTPDTEFKIRLQA